MAIAIANSTCTSKWKLKAILATVATPRINHAITAARNRKLKSPIHTAEALYNARTEALVYEKARIEAVTKLIDRTPSVIGNHSLSAAVTADCWNVHVS